MKKTVLFLLACALLISPAFAADTLSDDDIAIKAPSAVLMEKTSGELIYEKNAHERMHPASVTKVMTMLLIVEALERGDIDLNDTVTASSRAASFGGSCVFLEEGERMSVHEMLKCIAVVSANDCAVAMSEHLAGTEQEFVRRMNERAEELGLNDTHFCNCTGLFDEDEHYTTAYDIAVMSRELIRHDIIKDYTTIWMDSIRNGEFGLSNTNKLVYYYEGCTGLKTGFTSKAMYCLSATAMRDGVEYIAVIMHGETIESRNEDAKTLLNYAFANYTLCPLRLENVLPPVAVELGKSESIQPLYLGQEAMLIKKSFANDIRYELALPEKINAPISEGDTVGLLKVYVGGELIREVNLVSDASVDRVGIFGILLKLTGMYIGLMA